MINGTAQPKLHNRIRAFREKKGYGQEELARRYRRVRNKAHREADLRLIQAAEAGEEITLVDLMLIAEALEAPPNLIFRVDISL